jgi:hypothetical protein
VKRRVIWVTALINQILRSFLFEPNLNDLRIPGLVLAEMGAEAALSNLKLHERAPPGSSIGRIFAAVHTT